MICRAIRSGLQSLVVRAREHSQEKEISRLAAMEFQAITTGFVRGANLHSEDNLDSAAYWCSRRIRSVPEHELTERRSLAR